MEALAERAVAARVIDADEARALLAQRQLAARVIRVDDFDADLGASLYKPPQASPQRQAKPARQRVAA